MGRRFEKKKRTTALSALLLILALTVTALTGCGQAPEPGAAPEPEGMTPEDTGSGTGTALTVYGFSAGAADAFLLTTAHSAVLIDCGKKKLGDTIVDYLKAHGIQKLDVLIVTHFDKDHVGGAAAVLTAVPVDQVLQSDYPKDSKPYRNYLAALEKTGQSAETVSEDRTFTLDGVQYQIDPPDGGYRNDQSNNSSLIVSATNGADRLLFMGDAEEERTAEFLETHQATGDFLKVPHHGREDDGSAALFAAVRPKIAVITSSDKEPEDASVTAMLRSGGAEVFLTRNGAVCVESSGDGVTARYL